MPRFTFGSDFIGGGFPFLPGADRHLRLRADHDRPREAEPPPRRDGDRSPAIKFERFSHLKVNWEIFKQPFLLAWATIVGLIIGILPAIGGSASSVMAYDQAKKFSKTPERFGKGHPEGIIASEASNNANVSGSLMTIMAFGIPGDAVTAVMLGAMTIHGIQSGPLFISQNPDLAYGIYAAYILAHPCMLLICVVLMPLMLRVTSVRMAVLAPVVLVLCVIGAYALNNTMQSVYVLLIFGVVGYALVKLGFPLAPLILGLILGDQIEINLVRAIMTDGNPWLFLTRPISGGLLLAAAALGRARHLAASAPPEAGGRGRAGFLRRLWVPREALDGAPHRWNDQSQDHDAGISHGRKPFGKPRHDAHSHSPADRCRNAGSHHDIRSRADADDRRARRPGLDRSAFHRDRHARRDAQARVRHAGVVGRRAGDRAAPGDELEGGRSDDVGVQAAAGVKFHDGSDFTSEDVKFSITRMQTPMGPNPTTIYVRRVKEVQTPDPLTVRVVTDGPAPNLPNDFIRLFIVSHKAAAGVTKENANEVFNSGKAAVGTGPYKFVSWTPKGDFVAERFDGYWGGKEPWARIVRKEIANDSARVAQLKAGQLDLITRVPASDVATLERDPKISVAKIDTVYVFNLEMDMREQPPAGQISAKDGSALPKNPYLDIRVREAIDLAIDRKALAEIAMEGLGKPVNQVVTPSIFGYNKALPERKYDLAAAKKLMADAGYPNGFKIAVQLHAGPPAGRPAGRHHRSRRCSPRSASTRRRTRSRRPCSSRRARAAISRCRCPAGARSPARRTTRSPRSRTPTTRTGSSARSTCSATRTPRWTS